MSSKSFRVRATNIFPVAQVKMRIIYTGFQVNNICYGYKMQAFCSREGYTGNGIFLRTQLFQQKFQLWVW